MKVIPAAIIMVVLALIFQTGCFCTYHGKLVSRSDAENMKRLGMDVQCR